MAVCEYCMNCIMAVISDWSIHYMITARLRLYPMKIQFWIRCYTTIPNILRKNTVRRHANSDS